MANVRAVIEALEQPAKKTSKVVFFQPVERRDPDSGETLMGRYTDMGIFGVVGDGAREGKRLCCSPKLQAECWLNVGACCDCYYEHEHLAAQGV